MELVSE
jgi:hypothetical protein